MVSPDVRPIRSSRLADRLAQAEQQSFVGRRAEIEAFRRAVQSPQPPFSVLFVHGPGGVGKTTLLGEFARIASDSGVAVLRLDGRRIEPSPPGFITALSNTLGVAGERSAIDCLAEKSRSVLMIDTYEALGQIDGWLRGLFLPQIPGEMLVVIAGRNPPAIEWRTEPGWRNLMRVFSLRNLRPEEAQELLRLQDIPEADHDPVLAFTHGHPLALALVADVLKQSDGALQFDPEQVPDTIRLLLDRFTHGVTEGLQRQALEICAHVRFTTEDLLADALSVGDAHELFDWLRGLSFIEQGPEGIFPHDLARDVLDLDLRWRSPERYRDMHQRVRKPIIQRLEQARGVEQQRAFFDLLFLHRNNSLMKSFHHWDRFGSIYAEPAQPEDHPSIVAMVREHEGQESAAIAEYWLDRQPQAFHAFRTLAGELEGFACLLVLREISAEDEQADPAVSAAQSFARTFGSIRAGETMLLQRFHMARDTYQEPSPVLDLMAPTSMSYWMLTPRLAWSFMVMHNANAWRQMFAHLNLRESDEAGFSVGDRQFTVFTHDWRAEPVGLWLDVMAGRELAADTEAGMQSLELPAPLIVLSQPEFASAVRDALRSFTRPDILSTSPLLRSRLVVEHAGGEPSPETLQRLLQTAAETLRARPRDERLYRAVHHTYFQPAGTQELAAELLDLPFSTYRYHLNAGVGRITEWLWQRETVGIDS